MVVVGAQGAEPLARRAAACCAHRGSPARLRRLRGHHPARAVRQRHRRRLGSRHVGARGRRGLCDAQGPADLHAARREALRPLAPRADARHWQAGELAPVQEPRRGRERDRRCRRGAPEERAVGADDRAGGGGAGAHVAVEPRRLGGGAPGKGRNGQGSHGQGQGSRSQGSQDQGSNDQDCNGQDRQGQDHQDHQDQGDAGQGQDQDQGGQGGNGQDGQGGEGQDSVSSPVQGGARGGRRRVDRRARW